MEKKFSRRDFLKTSIVSIGAVAISGVGGIGGGTAFGQNRSRVFFYKGYQR
jgi:hypothetical protein